MEIRLQKVQEDVLNLSWSDIFLRFTKFRISIILLVSQMCILYIHYYYCLCFQVWQGTKWTDQWFGRNCISCHQWNTKSSASRWKSYRKIKWKNSMICTLLKKSDFCKVQWNILRCEKWFWFLTLIVIP